MLSGACSNQRKKVETVKVLIFRILLTIMIRLYDINVP